MSEAVWNNPRDVRLKIERISSLITDVAATPFRWLRKPVAWVVCLLLCILFHFLVSRDLRKKRQKVNHDIAECRRFIAVPPANKTMDALGKEYLRILQVGHKKWDSWMKEFEPLEKLAEIPGLSVAPHRAILKRVLRRVVEFRSVIDGYSMIVDELEMHWPWLNEERISESRKEYARVGGVELSEMIRNGAN